jgi:hypothetical protein
MNSEKENILLAVEELRIKLLDMVNTKMDVLIQRIENNENGEDSGNYEFPLSANPAFFKGTKPTSLCIGGDWFAVKTWREVYTLVLANANTKHHESLMSMRNILAGRKRVVLSDKPEGMDFPIKIDDELYAEADFDTEWLIKTLRRILGSIQYDYKDISVTFRKAGEKF